MSTQVSAAWPGDPGMFGWPALFGQWAWSIPTAQFQALLTWQQAVYAMQQELWDEWTAHWAGGAPIGD